jgi:hypothetical protein
MTPGRRESAADKECHRRVGALDRSDTTPPIDTLTATCGACAVTPPRSPDTAGTTGTRALAQAELQRLLAVKRPRCAAPSMRLLLTERPGLLAAALILRHAATFPNGCDRARVPIGQASSPRCTIHDAVQG